MTPETAGGEREDSARAKLGGPSRAIDLGRELTGSLPCAGCGYDLKSMSIRGVCPECATPVRATLLARIDPYAEQLQPIRYPMLTAAGLLTWAWAALGAGILTWVLRAADAWAVALDHRIATLHGVTLLATACIVLAGLAAVVLVRPHRGIPLRQRLAAAGAVLCTWAFAAVYWRIHAQFDPSHLRPYFEGGMLLTDRTDRLVLRLISSALLLGIIFGLRPNLRMLAARSLVMRMGRVERQTMLALALAVLIGSGGDLLQLVAIQLRSSQIVADLGVFLVATGSMLFTVGLAGIVLDAIRLVPVILRPPISMSQVLGEPGKAVGENARD